MYKRKYLADFDRMIKVELVVTDEQKADAIAAIIHAATTGKTGTAEIIVSPINNAIRIGTDESGVKAV